MKLDVLATEEHFIAHLAPVWRALPEEVRGTFHVHPSLTAYARSLGLATYAGPASGHDPILVASWGDTKRALAVPGRPIARMEHGIGQSYAGDPRNTDAVKHPSYAGGTGAERVGLYLVPNASSADRWRCAYPSANVAIVGSPKLDDVPTYRPSNPPTVAVSFHWDALDVCPETRSAFPHFQKAVTALKATHHVVGHAHPRFANVLSRWFARQGIAFYEHFRDVLEVASLYVMDNSSTLYEFAATGRPVVVLNAPHFRRNIEHGLRFWEAANVGVQVDDPADLRSAVDAALADAEPLRTAREAALDVVYAHRNGAAQRASVALVEWLASLSTAKTPRTVPVERQVLARERAEWLRQRGKTVAA